MTMSSHSPEDGAGETGSDQDDIPVPPYLHSGVVAVITVLAVLFTIIIIVAAYYLFTSWRPKNNVKRRNNPGRLEEEGEVGGYLPPVDRLREDTVLVEDAVFNDSLYEVSQEHKPEPSPVPSIFKESAFLQEILTSVAEIERSRDETQEKDNLVPEIIDDVIDNILSNSEPAPFTQSVATVELESPKEDERAFLLRNESYHLAIDDMESPCSNLPSGYPSSRNPFLSDLTGSDMTPGTSFHLEQLQLSSSVHSVSGSEEKEPKLSVESPQVSVMIERGSQYHSTPILEGQHHQDSCPASPQQFSSARLNLERGHSLSYIPVYTPTSSFIKYSKH